MELEIFKKKLHFSKFTRTLVLLNKKNMKTTNSTPAEILRKYESELVNVNREWHNALMGFASFREAEEVCHALNEAGVKAELHRLLQERGCNWKSEGRTNEQLHPEYYLADEDAEEYMAAGSDGCAYYYNDDWGILYAIGIVLPGEVEEEED